MKKSVKKILEAGLALWPEISYSEIALKSGMTHPNVMYHFPSLNLLKVNIAFYAVEVGNSRVILQLIATDHPAVKDLSQAERIKHFNAI